MKEKIKILFIVNTFKRGGATRAFLNQINELNKRKYPVYLATVLPFNKEQSFLEELEINKERILHLGSISIFKLKIWIKLIKFIKQNKINIVYSTMDRANLVARLLKIIKPRLKVVTRESGMYFRKSLKDKFLNFILNKFTNKIVVMTETMKVELESSIQRIYRNKIRIIPNTTKFDDWEKVVEKRKKDFETFKILNVGRMRTEDKGQIELIKIMHEIIDEVKINNLKLILVGDGPRKAVYEKYVQDNNLNRIIEFKGKISTDEIFKLYRSVDVLISNSLSEGFSNVIVEAMSSGLPVISTRVSGAIESIKDMESGILVESCNSTDLKKGIHKLLKDIDLRNKISKNAFENAKEKYSVERGTDKLIKLYTELCVE